MTSGLILDWSLLSSLITVVVCRRCPQIPLWKTTAGNALPFYEEDCLYLNVWTPQYGCDLYPKRCSRLRTVLLFLFSVGFYRGGNDWYDGSLLAALGDMVVVAPNYRLGALSIPSERRLTISL